ncbi:MAG TPA: PA2169 family four-helix-bundle protein, partial [Flavipsychrobacter sp.]
MNNAEIVEVLNDLIRINNDRVEGYRRAISEVKDIDSDLKDLFSRFIANSENHRSRLSQKVASLDGEVETGTTNSGKIYRVWMDMKASFSGDNRQAALESCEFGEDAAQKAYKEALDAYQNLPANVLELITEQKAELRQDHDLIKQL